MDGERLLESDCSMVTIVVCECVSAKRKPEKCSGNAQGVWREGGWGEAELLHTILPVSQHDCLRSSMAKDKKGLIRVQWISALKAGGDCRVASDSTMTPDKCTWAAQRCGTHSVMIPTAPNLSTPIWAHSAMFAQFDITSGLLLTQHHPRSTWYHLRSPDLTWRPLIPHPSLEITLTSLEITLKSLEFPEPHLTSRWGKLTSPEVLYMVHEDTTCS